MWIVTVLLWCECFGPPISLWNLPLHGILFSPLLMQLYSARLIGSEESRFGQSPLSWARHRRIQMKCRSSPALLQTTLITICWNVIMDFCPMLSTSAQRTSIWPKRCSLFVHLQRKKGPRLTAYQSKIRSRHNSWIPITTRIPMSLNISVRCFLLNGRCLLLRGCSMQGSRVCKSTRFIRGGRTE